VPRSPALRAVKWAVLFDALVVARDHWQKLSPGERAHLAALLRKSRAQPGKLTPGERRDVRRLAAKLDLPTLGRNLAPVARRLRPARAESLRRLSRPMTSLQDRTRFEPSEVEPRIVERWLASGLHHPSPRAPRPRTTRSPSRRPTSRASCTWATRSTARCRTR